MISLSDTQLSVLMSAAGTLDPGKRGVFLDRVSAHLKHGRAGRQFGDDDIARAVELALRGLRASVSAA
jgi:hypothetical protein